MKAMSFHSRGGPEAFVFEELPEPWPGEGQILIRVHATAVTPTELSWNPTWTAADGKPRPFPIIPGHEFSGEVAELGQGVSGFAVGDLVYGMNDWFSNGALAEYCVAKPSEISPKPKLIDHTAAAVTPISALTAWQGLFDRGQLEKDKRVLIHGAAGAVGIFAVQLARWTGAHVVGTASPRNTEFLKIMGCDEVIDYHQARFEDVARDIDVVFDTVGGETLARSWSVLKPEGKLITIAASEEDTKDSKTRDAFFIVEGKAEQLAEITKLIDAGTLRPEVDSVFPLHEAKQAFEYKPTHGKVALQVAPLR